MNPQDPNTPKRPARYYDTPEEPSGSGGGAGMWIIGLLLLALAAGAVYYFAVYKRPAVSAGPPPLATPAVARAATPAPRNPDEPPYGDETKAKYVKQAETVFLAQRHDKSQAFVDAFKTLQAAGAFASKGLTSKEAITARRALVAKCQAANDDYIAFINAQEATYRAELAKTPLVPKDVDTLTSDFASKANTAAIIKLREGQRQLLKEGDDMLAALDRWYGSWTVDASGKLILKKTSDVSEYRALQQKYSATAAEVQKAQAEVNAANPDLSATPPEGSPAASPMPTNVPVAASPSP